MPRFTPAVRNAIKRLRRSDVEATLSGLSSSLARSKWLASTNRYATNTIKRLTADVANPALFNPKQLSYYISASSILHCADGWSYLGRAVHCLLRGDPHRVLHLAYYAELRAALSILAAEGIGIFNRRHFVIDGPQSSRNLSISRPTHEMVWDCLNYWGKLKRSSELFSEIITPGGVAISDWFQSVGGVEKVITPQAQAWFRQWSMDLSQFTEDRSARNESSYRPDGIPTSWYIDGSDALNFATELWEICEPSPGDLFANIDRQILRLSVESAFRGTSGHDPSARPEDYRRFILGVVNSMAFEPAIENEWVSFLTREVSPNDSQILEHSKYDAADRAFGHTAILARAVLMLRLATGSSIKLIRGAGLPPPQLKFWWSALGLNRGLWEGARDGGDLLDLWQDISELVKAARAFQIETPSANQTFYRIGNKLPHVVSGFGSLERVAIWSLAL